MTFDAANPFSSSARAERILIVDDDPAIRKVVQLRLETAGYRVWTAESGPAALSLIDERGLPHLALVDVMMPEMNGFEFCEQILSFSDLPVIMLTAVSDEQSVVRGICFYAEDYVTKPFRPAELVARVERVLRRLGHGVSGEGRLVEIDDYLGVDFAHQRALLDDQPVDLTPTESKLLYILMRNAGRPVGTDFLLQRLWPNEERYEEVLRVHVYRLRQKIEPDPRRPRYILTERELGYTFVEKPESK